MQGLLPGFRNFSSTLAPRKSACRMIRSPYVLAMNLTKRQLESGGVVIELEGDADLAAAPVFQEAVEGVMKDHATFLVIDFTKTTFVNTPIWAVVVQYYQHTTKANTGMAVSGLSGRVAASFGVVRLGEFISSYPTAEEAINALS